MSGKIITKGRGLVWIALYPKRRFHTMLIWQTNLPKISSRRFGKWYVSIGLGPLYVGLGPGIPDRSRPTKGVHLFFEGKLASWAA